MQQVTLTKTCLHGYEISWMAQTPCPWTNITHARIFVPSQKNHPHARWLIVSCKNFKTDK